MNDGNVYWDGKGVRREREFCLGHVKFRTPVNHINGDETGEVEYDMEFRRVT